MSVGQQYVPVDTVASRVKALRIAHGLSQRDAAKRCGLTIGEWQGIEDGRDFRGEGRKLRQISEGFAIDGVPVSLDWLQWGEVAPTAVRVRLSREAADAGQTPFSGVDARFSGSDMDALLDAIEQQHHAAVA